MKVRRLTSGVSHIAIEDCATRSATSFGVPFETPMTREVECLCGVRLSNREHRVAALDADIVVNCRHCALAATRAVRAARSARN